MRPQWVAHIKSLLEPGEEVECMVREHRLGSPEPLAPAILFATNKRIIIIRVSPFKIRMRYTIIDYKAIVDVQIDKSVIWSRIHFDLKGLESDPNPWLSGLWYKDAESVCHFVEQMREQVKDKD